MNKIVKYSFFIVIFGLFFIPRVVFGAASTERTAAPAEEVGQSDELPREGVTYFITYPNGHEVITENYDEAVNPSEVVVYEGNTNSNGEIIIEDMAPEGQLRIIEDVPFGYTTNQREILLNLDESNAASFVNNRGLVNPQTGTSFLFIIFVVALIGVLFYYLNIKVKKARAVELVLLIVLGGFMSTSIINATAAKMAASVAKETKSLVISVNDNHGKRMDNVRVKIFAKAVKVEASPAVKFSANGGTFFDGTDLMYFRLPYNGCTETEFYDSLSSFNSNYLDKNTRLATRPGYVNAKAFNKEPADSKSAVAKREIYDVKEETTARKTERIVDDRWYNGKVVNLEWIQDSNAFISTYHLNGGTVDFYGKKLTTFKREQNVTFEVNVMYNDILKNIVGPNYFVGYSDNEQCSEYSPYGLIEYKDDVGAKKRRVDISANMYACWNSRPDGIYVNDQLFRGNSNNCFETSGFDSNYNRKAFSLNGRVMFFDITSENIGVSYLYASEKFLINDIPVINGDSDAADDAVEKERAIRRRVASDSDVQMMVSAAEAPKNLLSGISFEEITSDPINSIKVIFHGEEIVNLSQNDFTCDGIRKYCTINNNEKINRLKDYLSIISSKCIKDFGDSRKESAK